MMRRRLALALLLTIGATVAACADQYDPTPTSTPLPDLLENGVVATFEVPSGEFSVFTTEPATIETLYQLQTGEISGVIPSGVLSPGAGAEDHNAPWSWHLHRQTVALVDSGSPVCDAPLQQVENNLENWLQNIRRYCPSDAELLDITDYR